MERSIDRFLHCEAPGIIKDSNITSGTVLHGPTPARQVVDRAIGPE